MNKNRNLMRISTLKENNMHKILLRKVILQGMNIILISKFRHKNNRKCIKSSYFKNIRLKCTFFLTKKGYNFFILNIFKKNF